MGFFDKIRGTLGAIGDVAEAGAAAPSASTPPIVADPNKRMPTIKPDGGAATGGGGDPQSFIEQWQATHPPTRESMQQLVDALNQQGWPVMIASRAGGSAASGDKIILPDGTVTDLISDEGGANAGWMYSPNPEDRFGGGHTVYDAQGNPVNYGEFLQKRGLPVPTATPGAGGVGAPPGGGGGQYGNFTMGYSGGRYPLSSVQGIGLMAPFNTEFQAPAYEDVGTDPAFRFRMNEGQQAIERAAASKGTLLTGGTLKDLNAWAQGLASEEYDKIYGRRLGEYQNAFNIFDRNRNFQYGALSDVAGTGLSAANAGAQYGSGYAGRSTNLRTDQGNVEAGGQAAYARGAGEGAATIGGLWPDSWRIGGGGTQSTGEFPTGGNPTGGYGGMPAGWQGPIQTPQQGIPYVRSNYDFNQGGSVS